MSLYTSVVITWEYNVLVYSEELIGTTQSRIKRCRYNRIRQYIMTASLHIKMYCR